MEYRKKKEAEKQRVLLEIPLDLSTATFNLETTEAFIQPCTSAYLQ